MKISDFKNRFKKFLGKLGLLKQSKQEPIDSKTTNNTDFKSMKLEDLETQLDKLYLPKMQKKAVLGTIELKVDYEMKSVIERMGYDKKNILEKIDGTVKTQNEINKSIKSELIILRWVVISLGLIITLIKLLK